MTIHQFIQSRNVRPADAIIMQKKFFGMVDHYVIYAGISNRKHVFIANYNTGVQIVPNRDIEGFLKKLIPTNVDRCPEQNRRNALSRAWNSVGKEAYSLFQNNCEHFKNWVHHGVRKSKQVENFQEGLKNGLGALAVIAILVAVFKR